MSDLDDFLAALRAPGAGSAADPWLLMALRARRSRVECEAVRLLVGLYGRPFQWVCAEQPDVLVVVS